MGPDRGQPPLISPIACDQRSTASAAINSSRLTVACSMLHHWQRPLGAGG